MLPTLKFRGTDIHAVNHYDDSDTPCAVTGGLAGLVYGVAGIPEDWMAQITRRDDIEDLAKRMAARLGSLG